MRAHGGSGSLMLVAMCAVAACADPFGGGGIELQLTLSDSLLVIDPVLPVGDSILVSVTATNTSNERIEWGQGSSSCQLSAVVRVDHVDRRIDIRGCTDDLGPQGLDGGATRTEAWYWKGAYLGDGTGGMLKAGTYETRAVAGTESRSAPRPVRVVAVR